MANKKTELWRMANSNDRRGTKTNFNGETVRVLDFKVPEDRKYYEEWEHEYERKHCAPDEELVKGYWTNEGYHKSYCRKKRRNNGNKRRV